MSSVNTTQIAERLRLSRNTVSKALNGNPEVSENTRQMVIETALEMGYKKMPAAAAGIKHTVGNIQKDICLLVHQDEIDNLFWNRILQGVEKYLSARNHRLILGISNADEENRMQLPAVIKNSRLSGIIMIGIFDEAYYRLVHATGFPLVTIDSAASIWDHNLISDMILTCNESCVYSITEKIIGQGIRDIAFVGEHEICRSLRERWMGYRNAMKYYDIPINSAYDCLQQTRSHQLIGQILQKMDTMPRALICINDNMANEAIRVVQSRGLRVPEDVMVSGFDNFDHISSPFAELTSVNYNIVELGIQAARQLLYRIEAPSSPLCLIRLESHVIFRRSTELPV